MFSYYYVKACHILRCIINPFEGDWRQTFYFSEKSPNSPGIFWEGVERIHSECRYLITGACVRKIIRIIHCTMRIRSPWALGDKRHCLFKKRKLGASNGAERSIKLVFSFIDPLLWQRKSDRLSKSDRFEYMNNNLRNFKWAVQVINNQVEGFGNQIRSRIELWLNYRLWF